MQIKDEKELNILRKGGRKLAEVLSLVSKKAVVGMTTEGLDEYAERLILERGGRPSFKGYKDAGIKNAYPASLCTSLNDEIVHAIPSGRVLKNGDIIGLDLGMEWQGLFTDMAITIPVGEIDKQTQKLIEVTKKALNAGIGAVRAGATVGDIGHAIQKCATLSVAHQGFGVVKELVGHGVGRGVHEQPEIPNWGEKGKGVMLKEGMVIALEPMFNIGSDQIKLDSNSWTWRTRDGSLSAHFEHTMVVTKSGAEVLTKF